MSDTHTLIITAYADSTMDEPTELDFTVECPGVTDACRMWVECDVAGCGSTNAERDHNIVLHGTRHQLISSTWSIPTDTCYLIAADEMPDTADFLATQQELGAGRYLVGHDFNEGCIADFQLIEKVPA